MTETEKKSARVHALQDRAIESFKPFIQDFERISEHGPSQTEYDDLLCQKMASGIAGILYLQMADVELEKRKR